MKSYLILALLSAGAAAFAQVQPPEIPYDSVPNFLKLPANLYLGEAAGVAVNSKGHVFVFSRSNTTGPAFGAAAAQLLEFGPDGKYIREIGKNLYAWSFAHAVRIDKDDNIWVSRQRLGHDCGVQSRRAGRDGVRTQEGSRRRRRHAVDARQAAAPGHRRRIPATDGCHLGSRGQIFISDGYINSRVAKYDRNGDWVKQWGEPGSGPGEFNTPHSIVADAQGNIYVADRGNRRIQVFDHDGTFLREITIDIPAPADAQTWMGPRPNPRAPDKTMQPGSPWALCITPGPTQYLYSSDAFPGRIYKLTLDGKVVGMFGRTGRQLKQFGWIHGLACPSENEIYAAELLNWRVQKLILHPEK